MLYYLSYAVAIVELVSSDLKHAAVPFGLAADKFCLAEFLKLFIYCSGVNSNFTVAQEKNVL